MALSLLSLIAPFARVLRRERSRPKCRIPPEAAISPKVPEWRLSRSIRSLANESDRVAAAFPERRTSRAGREPSGAV